MSVHDFGRRRFLQAGTGAGTALASRAAQAARPDNRIVQENSKPGTNAWQLQRTQFDNPVTLMSYPLNRQTRSSVIEGYVSKTSALPGESIDIMVSMNPPSRCVIDFYRMGYYGGAGGRHMARIGPFQASTQPVPMMTMERLRECAWEPCTRFTIPKEWPSGVYLGKLTRDEKWGPQSYVVFVVKERRRSDLLFMTADLTWQAYNKWPGKDSLYDDGTPEVWYTGPNVRVSYRPAVREVLPGGGCAALGGLRKFSAVGTSARVLARAARLRRDILLEHRSGTRSGHPANDAGALLGRA